MKYLLIAIAIFGFTSRSVAQDEFDEFTPDTETEFNISDEPVAPANNDFSAETDELDEAAPSEPNYVPAAPSAPVEEYAESDNINENDDIIFEEENAQDVEVVSNDRLFLPYKERRTTHGWSFAFDVENVLLSSYQSEVSNNLKYNKVYGDEAVMMPTLRVGYKYNMDLGSILLEGSYGKFSIADNLSGVYHELDVSRMSLGGNLLMDMLFEEPWVVPYAGIHAYTMEISETNTSTGRSQTMTTKFGQQYILGLLLQMNWADKDAARTALQNYGLENSYINIFMSKYALTSGSGDPDTETDFNYGFGIRFEF